MRFLLAIPFILFGTFAVASNPVTYQYDHVRNLIVAIPVAPDYYYSVGDADAQEQLVKRIVEELDKRRATPPKEREDDNSPFRLMGGGGGGPSLDRQVAALFNASCVKCHKPGSSKPGNVVLLGADREMYADPNPAREKSRRARVVESVLSGDMPKDAPSLPQSAKDLLEKWKTQAR